MKNMKDGFKWQVSDKKERILFGRRYNGQVIFMRYVGISSKERKMILSIYAFIIGVSEKNTKNKKMKKMADFLNFKDDDKKDNFCG